MSSKMVKAILDGIYEAHETQWRRSGQQKFNPAESVYLSKIADSLFNNGYKYMNYEFQAKEIINELEIPSNSSITASGGKIDLLLRDNDRKPSAIVEVKAEFGTYSALEKDIFRICDFLNNLSKEKSNNYFGIFAVGLVRYIETDIRGHLIGSLNAIEKNVVSVVTHEKQCEYKRHTRDIEDKGDIVWGGTCFIIQKH